MTFVVIVACSLFCFCSKVSYIARSDQSDQGTSLIRVHSVCFHKKKSEVHLNICSRYKKPTTFSGQKKNIDRIRVN